MNQNNNDISGTAEINGAKLYYEVKGKGHPLLLLHAGVADSRMWDDQFDTFAEKYRVVRFDYRGFGRSDMPSSTFSNIEDVRAILDYLDMESSYIVAISFGGLIAIDFTLTYPDRVKALVLGAPSVNGDTASDRVRQFWEEEDALLEQDDLAGATELNMRLWVDGPYREPGEVDSAVRQKVYDMQLTIFLKEIPDDVDEIGPEIPAIERLNEIKIPVQVMVGDQDLPEKVALADRLEKEIPNCKKVVIPGVAHMLNMEKPGVFKAAVIDFLLDV